MISDIAEKIRDVAETSHELNRIILQIMNKSANLKTISDGFEVVLNKRSQKRDIISPLVNCLITCKGNETYGFLFDISEEGISFYHLTCSKKIVQGDIVTISYDSKKYSEYNNCNYEITYKSDTEGGDRRCFF